MHAREKLGEGEWLDQIIICTELETLHAILYRVVSREE
jgi:hypothetical protein